MPCWSARKPGAGIDEVLEAVVTSIPPPKESPDDPLRALIFDSWFDPYRGVIILARVIEGRMRIGQKIRLWASGGATKWKVSAINRPKPVPADELSAGEVGYLFANIKTVSDAQIGDTIIDEGESRERAAARLRAHQADGVRRAVSGGVARARPAARCARKTCA